MSEEETNANLDSIDREPPTSDAAQSADGSESHSIPVRNNEWSSDDSKPDNENKSEQPDSKLTEHNNELSREHQWEPTKSVPTNHQPSMPVVSAPVQAETLPHPGPGLMVLQWLVYAFWGWTVLSLSALIFLVVGNLFDSGSDDSYSYFGGGIAYVLAATIVLFIISLVCDIFYAKAERKHAKSTGTNVIMIIHAVIFSLFGIGSLILAVFGLVQVLIGDTSDTTGATTTILSGSIIFVIYGITLLRTLRPRWIKGIAGIYWLVMTIAIITTVALSVMGPVAEARMAVQDKPLESGLPTLADQISTHVSENSALPLTLSELDGLSGDAKKIVDEKLVEYTPGEKLNSKSTGPMGSDTTGMSQLDGTVPVIYHYELCVDYKAKSGSGYGGTDAYRVDGEQYATTLYVYDHKAGRVCYDLQTGTSY